ncbi:MAG: hypothetical protein GXO45_00165 [Aquificae bacterium]|nr:hypothetical protein [Aquificota bacterium]
MLKVGNLWIDLYKVYAYRLEKDDSGYFFVFYIENKEIEIPKKFPTEKDALEWIECLEMEFADLFLSDEEIECKREKTKGSKKFIHKTKQFIRDIFVFAVIMFVLFSFVLGSVEIIKKILSFFK